MNVIFSFVDANPDAPSRNKIDNVMAMSMVPERDRVYLTLSGAASFTGAVSVIFASKGRYRSALLRGGLGEECTCCSPSHAAPCHTRSRAAHRPTVCSNYSFGIINSTLFGLFAWAFGYGGDAQMNLIFFNILQVRRGAGAAPEGQATRMRGCQPWIRHSIMMVVTIIIVMPLPAYIACCCLVAGVWHVHVVGEGGAGRLGDGARPQPEPVAVGTRPGGRCGPGSGVLLRDPCLHG